MLGDTLTVSFQTGDLGILVDAQATVVRLVQGRRRGSAGSASGCASTRSMAFIKRLVVRGALRKARPPLPQRARELH